MPTTVIAVLLALASGGAPGEVDRPAVSQGFSLLGKPLFPPPLPEQVEIERRRQLKEAHLRWEQNPGDVEAAIWVGRRTAYLGLYQDAIEVYDRAIERFPDDPRLYRHRGHRYITVRKFDLAIADLERAVKLIQGTEDRVEPDGLPNARNQPTSTLHGNIWYHLGLAYYLEGDFEQALRCYRECLALATNPDMLCATSHWMYMTLRRMGRTEQARALLEPIDAALDVIENHAYHELLLMYKGQRDAGELLERAAAGDGPEFAATAYGVANWDLYRGHQRRAYERFEALLADDQWAAFGYIAAEAELASRRGDR
ncbi:MAG TPA: tetratricopeptide repeat protein [Candidatus Polarisedimenticolaceae bacterium]|nr:tetratricopeptide repeat protein [Candidatus Polarisedimenticolaceae bacterium]